MHFEREEGGYHRLGLRNEELVESWTMHVVRNQTKVNMEDAGFYIAVAFLLRRAFVTSYYILLFYGGELSEALVR